MKFIQGQEFAALSSEGELLIYLAIDSCLIRVKPVNSTPGAFQPFLENPHLLQELADHLAQSRTSANSLALDKFRTGQKTRISALNLNMTGKCNLACVYCYAQGGDYARIQKDMDAPMALQTLDEALQASDPSLPFRIEFFGGEPLLNTEVIEAVIEWQKHSAAWKNHPGGTVNRISTNLTTLSGQQEQLLKEGNIIISISLDGPGKVQDQQRPFKDGRGSYDIIMGNIRRLREHMPQATIIARMTVYHFDQQVPEMVQELAETDLFDYVSIYPAAVSHKATTGHSHFSDHFQQGLLQVAKNYPQLLARGRFKGCLELNRYCEDVLAGQTVMNHCRAGIGYFTASPDGSIHPCHRLVGDPAWNLISCSPNEKFDFQSPATHQKLKDWRVMVDERDFCKTCAIRYLCGGGCKQQSLLSTGSLIGHDPNICAFARLLFEASLHVMNNLSQPVREKLTRSFAELTRLFVLCGQLTERNGRTSFPPLEPFKFHGIDLSLTEITLGEAPHG